VSLSSFAPATPAPDLLSPAGRRQPVFPAASDDRLYGLGKARRAGRYTAPATGKVTLRGAPARVL